jgi:predicted transcriptional regulator
MPAVSSYLSKDVFENVKAKAKAVDASVSRIIREAVENYLRIDEQKEARERVLKILSEKKPLNGNSSWEDIHQERTLADVDRS